MVRSKLGWNFHEGKVAEGIEQTIENLDEILVRPAGVEPCGVARKGLPSGGLPPLESPPNRRGASPLQPLRPQETTLSIFSARRSQTFYQLVRPAGVEPAACGFEVP